MNTHLITYLPTAIFILLAAIGGAILPKQIKVVKEDNNLILAVIVGIVAFSASAYIAYGSNSGSIQSLLEDISPYSSVGLIILGMISFLATFYFLGSHYGTFGPFMSGISLGYFFGLYLLDPQQYVVHGFISVLIFFFCLIMGIIISKKHKTETEE